MRKKLPRDATSGDRFRGWTRPGPEPPGGEEPAPGETLDRISGRWRIFQNERGHRFSTDDLLVAWWGTVNAGRVERALDLGSGIGSVALVVAWRLPSARIVTLEAQAESIALARKSVRYNGLESRVCLVAGDLRDRPLLPGEPPFDLVTGSPPYYVSGTVTEPRSAQAIGARVETRGTVADYALAASELLAAGGLFAFVFPFDGRDRANRALVDSGLSLVRSRDVLFREGETPRLTLFAAMRESDLPAAAVRRGARALPSESPLVVRTADGRFGAEYGSIRLSIGFPPVELDPEG